jgi:hypothetical protein
MMETIGNTVHPIDSGEFARWFGRAHEPWSPIMAAERQLAALSVVTETPPVLAAYDHLYEMAGEAVRWLELDSCPDKETGRRLKAQMMAYRIVAATVRFTFSARRDALVDQRTGLRQLIDQQTGAMALSQPVCSASR